MRGGAGEGGAGEGGGRGAGGGGLGDGSGGESGTVFQFTLFFPFSIIESIISTTLATSC